MSDTYLQFCEALVLESPEEKAWFERHMNASYIDSSDGEAGDHWNEEGEPITEEAKFWKPVLDDTDDDMACFEWEFENLSGKSCVLFYSEDHGCVAHVAQLVQHFFKTMRPNGKDGFAISWAETCSKSQPGQFGGGACFVTKEEIRWLSTWQWLDELATHLHVE